ncbi:hypothetical protein CRE_29360 [Caenorhabditis remanei]|uniref:Uncharacterized protein n=1 Tax=Caenorhabditis remanei TaxID=31234 RepID=E3MY24_CAERE|nr:hypothetical protein CRE_29360 [Caenorhabditis remanei]
MSTTLFLWFFSTTYFYTEISGSHYPLKTPIFIDPELDKISYDLISTEEHEKLTGNVFKHRMADFISRILLEEAQTIIGLSELRSVLGFAPSEVWKKRQPPSEEEVDAAPTVEAYYMLKEPISKYQISRQDEFLPELIPPAITFLEDRFPGIRRVYRRDLEEKFRSLGGKIDKNGVDDMIHEFRKIQSRVMHGNSYYFSYQSAYAS